MLAISALEGLMLLGFAVAAVLVAYMAHLVGTARITVGEWAVMSLVALGIPVLGFLIALNFSVRRVRMTSASASPAQVASAPR